MIRISNFEFRILLIVLFACGVLSACGPDYNQIANRLREQNMSQEKQIKDLQGTLAARDVTVRQLQDQVDLRTPRIPTLPDNRLNELFTAAKLEIRPQTDSWQIDASKNLTAFRVFIRTFSDDDTNIPATGTLTIEAFELPAAPAQPRRLGTWTFTPAEMKKNWYSGFGLNQFAFNCPWTAPATPPTTTDILFKATFLDALTGKALEAHLNKKITLP
ncbi:MAG: hypothetical protein FWD61_16640 [Phycisphaerales bacterium]|nr:hypothetical protein [Phycisphaerales bacterium]